MNENNKILIYQTEDGQTQVDVRMENETVWLSQAQMSLLFDKDRTVIGRHINNVFKEGELQKEYSLRQSMRGIEELMEKHGIVRCQRSYFVNPKHVTVLRRDKEGIIQAELDIHGMKAVPVSPKYYDQLSKML